MSSVKVQGNASGTGIFTVAAPATNTDRTLTLPDASGTLAVSGGALSGTTGSFSSDLSFNSGYGSSAVAYGCRAWVNFNGTTASPSTIRGSGNVSSVTKTGTGVYTVNFTNALPDINYSAVVGAGLGSGGAIQAGANAISAPTTSTLSVQSINGTGTAAVDATYVCVAIFR